MSGAECSKSRFKEVDNPHITFNSQSIFGGTRQKFLDVVSVVQITPIFVITKIRLRIESHRPLGIAQVDISRMNSFASTLRFDMHLQINYLSCDKAFQLATERHK